MQVSRWIFKKAWFLKQIFTLDWTELTIHFQFFSAPKKPPFKSLRKSDSDSHKKSSGSLGDNTPFAARVREGNSTADAKAAAAAVLVWHNTLRKAFYVCVCLTQL